jgi:hypothetical protein
LVQVADSPLRLPREEEKKLPSFVTVYNPYVLPEQASSYVVGGKHDKLYIAGPSAAQPSFAPKGPAPTPAELALHRIRPPHPMMPTRLWRQRFLANFLQLRAVSSRDTTRSTCLLGPGKLTFRFGGLWRALLGGVRCRT